MEAQRADGHAATPARYVRTAIGQYLRAPERTRGKLSLELPGEEPITGIALAIVQNTAPWTYLGPMPINACPDASFDLGLDVFAPHSLGLLPPPASACGWYGAAGPGGSRDASPSCTTGRRCASPPRSRRACRSTATTWDG